MVESTTECSIKEGKLMSEKLITIDLADIEKVNFICTHSIPGALDCGSLLQQRLMDVESSLPSCPVNHTHSWRESGEISNLLIDCLQQIGKKKQSSGVKIQLVVNAGPM